ncbi:hypothetical protein QYB97_09075 [Fictibacillus sp. NE201]|uniref:Uncharacterized protein n=2 Tax=Fictibacillus fluitans TaxID=3058422 RepID=A0ABT8HV19_9BACL|nr:hypothetical protein [Fictibacillus sp. NE201]MDN4524625.1 hypothetical protein [Fictibacillus sp. NE201]
MAEVDFSPLIQEQYDLVVLKDSRNLIQHVMDTIASPEYQTQLSQLKGYDLHLSGKLYMKSNQNQISVHRKSGFLF